MDPIIVAVGRSGMSMRMVDAVVRLAGAGNDQDAAVTVVHVARVWGTSLGLQHPALQPSASERGAAQEVAARAAQALRDRGVQADALVISGRDSGKALAAAAQRRGAGTIVVGRSEAGVVGRLLRGPDPARVLLSRAGCALLIVD